MSKPYIPPVVLVDATGTGMVKSRLTGPSLVVVCAHALPASSAGAAAIKAESHKFLRGKPPKNPLHRSIDSSRYSPVTNWYRAASDIEQGRPDLRTSSISGHQVNKFQSGFAHLPSFQLQAIRICAVINKNDLNNLFLGYYEIYEIITLHLRQKDGDLERRPPDITARAAVRLPPARSVPGEREISRAAAARHAYICRGRTTGSACRCRRSARHGR